MNYTTLNNGVKMPLKGLGVFQITDIYECERVVSDAISTGYRMIDTASVYGNEKGVGRAVKNCGVPREELFISTKAWVSEMGYERTIKAFHGSLERLGLDYIDLYLIHMPFGDYHCSWKAMERLYSEGRIRAIGVCNFEPDRLTDLCLGASVVPAINQIEIHPFNQQTDAIKAMQSLGIYAEAWAPLAEGRHGLFTNEILAEIGRKYGKTAAQVVLRWHMQRGVAAIPKSVRKVRMEENSDIDDFSLSSDDMANIAALSLTREQILNLRCPWEVKRLYGIKCND